MASTEHYNLHITDGGTETFLEWRKKMNGPEDSNMAKIDSALAGKQDALTGEEDQLVGFDASGKPIAVDQPETMTPYDYAVQGGYTGTPEAFQSILASGPWLPVAEKHLSFGMGTKDGASDGENVDINAAAPRVPFYAGEGIFACGKPIHAVADPMYSLDAANKGYVDGLIGEIGTLLDTINGEAV